MNKASKHFPPSSSLDAGEFETQFHIGILARLLLVFLWTGFTLLNAQAAVHYQQLKSFGFGDLLGNNPSAPLLRASDGVLYGTTVLGGRANGGVVFRLEGNGSSYTILHHFGITDSDGTAPQAGLIEGRDGLLYGTSSGGGIGTQGTVFKLNKDGTGYLILHGFSVGPEGGDPIAGLIEDSDEVLYGTTANGGAFGAGVVFKLNKDGTGYGVLHSFGSTGGDGNSPQAGLIEGSDGALYGTTTYGGTNSCFNGCCGCGILFRLSKNGNTYSILHTFGAFNGDGQRPQAGLVEGSDGALYGTTVYGGGSGCFDDAGAVFKINKDGSGYAIVHSFCDLTGDGWRPVAPLTKGSDGALYGTASQGGGAGIIFRLTQDGNQYAFLHVFSGIGGDGANPQASLMEDSNGVLFGTSYLGGDSGFGTIFKLNKDGTAYQVLLSFNQTGGDGQDPQAGLLQASDGRFYGTTSSGGSYVQGIVFGIASQGEGYRVLHSFSRSDGSNSDGNSPVAPLIEAADGMLYGVTPSGGTNGGGIVFKLKKNGSNYTVVFNFGSASDDAGGPYAPLLESRDGSLYGTTLTGGTNSGGTVFKLNKDGSAFAIVRRFDPYAGEGSPVVGLIEGTDGWLYGATLNGGSDNNGTLFKLSRDGAQYSTLRSFSSAGSDAQRPNGGLLLASDGVIYVTAGGGTNAAGTVLRINPDGTGYRVLYSFGKPDGDGADPASGVIEGSDGCLYGTTLNVAIGFSRVLAGTIFKLNKDGSNYRQLYAFSSGGGTGENPSGLIKGRDGVLYGTTFNGGDLGLWSPPYGWGTIFKLWPPETPDLTNLRLTAGIASFLVGGTSGYQYQVLRSPDLTNWTLRNSFTMPASGLYTNVDTTPLQPATFYRAAWVP